MQCANADMVNAMHKRGFTKDHEWTLRGAGSREGRLYMALKLTQNEVRGNGSTVGWLYHNDGTSTRRWQSFKDHAHTYEALPVWIQHKNHLWKYMGYYTFGAEQVMPARVVSKKGKPHSVDRFRLMTRVSHKLPKLPRRRLPRGLFRGLPRDDFDDDLPQRRLLRGLPCDASDGE